ncbi:uroplakin-3a isoform X2 [Hemicordylus capensis]|uniref:uroplakin-3a isoform X2 n=1 Tax=Hemicordylus capensis TaxID=884348 RepID=UPI0023030EF5|nr:uroplakin-3a isoform X2 [Hemicordylus capensis]
MALFVSGGFIYWLTMGEQWIVLLVCCFWQLCVGAQILRPQIANPAFAINNPTLTTVALEKPFCIFDGSISKGDSYKVYLYVMVDLASASRSSVTDNSSKPLDATFQQTNGGQSGPYKAAVFNVPNCASPPMLSDAADPTKVPAVLTQYLIRVGNDSSCLYDPNFQGVCNPPLSQDTTYRFKYLLADITVGVMKDQTPWSHPVKMKKLKQSTTIDTWPGRRSGGMIVICSILSVLMLLLMVGFLTAMFFAITGAEETVAETRYESQTIQEAVPRVQEISEQENE